MNRRELMMVGASTALARGVTTAMGCKAESGAARATTAAALVGEQPELRAEIMAAVGECLRGAEVCMAQCQRHARRHAGAARRRARRC